MGVTSGPFARTAVGLEGGFWNHAFWPRYQIGRPLAAGAREGVALSGGGAGAVVVDAEGGAGAGALARVVDQGRVGAGLGVQPDAGGPLRLAELGGGLAHATVKVGWWVA
ncbi:hypothetical protein GCM10020219_020860 [Nonomuraea dietziae]